MHRNPVRRNLTKGWLSLPAALAAALPLLPVAAQGPAAAPARPAPPTATYYVYAGAESADKIYRVRFGPGGTAVEREIVVGKMAAEMEGPHGLAISADGQFLHMTTGHGFPDGKYWVYALGADTLVAPGVLLGAFPASLDVTPDGRYMFSANFNLHGDMVPSSQSVVYIPTMTEVARIVTCTMPHGSRVSPDGRLQCSGRTTDDQLVEIDTKALKVSRRFSVAVGKEGPLAPEGDDMLQMWIDGAKRVSNGATADPAQGRRSRHGRPQDADGAADLLADLGAALGDRRAHLRRLQQGRRDPRDRARHLDRDAQVQDGPRPLQPRRVARRQVPRRLAQAGEQGPDLRASPRARASQIPTTRSPSRTRVCAHTHTE